MKLTNLSKQNVIIENVVEAKSYFSRLIGLMKYKNLERSKTLWLLPCNNIHTFFMRFSIDAVFVDRDLVVQAVYEDLQPGRVIWYVPKAHSCFEMNSGVARAMNVQKGDKLHVGH